jgi:ribonuclease D
MNDDLFPTNRLSSQHINSLPIIRFKGEIIMINTPEKADEHLSRLFQHPAIGFDTESRPSFKKGITYPLAIVQLATHETAYLLQIEKIRVPDILVDLFCNRKIKKIGIGIKNDLEKLQSIRPFIPNDFIDLSAIATRKGIIQVGARALSARYLEHRVTKNAQRSNWSNSNLSEKQKIYAATDAWICLQIYPLLIEDPSEYRQPEARSSDS